MSTDYTTDTRAWLVVESTAGPSWLVLDPGYLTTTIHPTTAHDDRQQAINRMRLLTGDREWVPDDDPEPPAGAVAAADDLDRRLASAARLP